MAKKKSKPKAASRIANLAAAKINQNTDTSTDGVVITTITVQKPKPGQAYLANVTGTGNAISVSVANTNTGSQFALIHAFADKPDAPADPNTSSFTPLTPSGTNLVGMVPIPSALAPIGLHPVSSNNIAITFVRYPTDGGTPEIKRVRFKYIQSPFLAVVGAWCCPWFAFRDDGTGPEGEDIAIHRPIRVRLPDNLGTLSVSATGHWRKERIKVNEGDNFGSGPDGLAGNDNNAPLANPDYKSESNADVYGMLEMDIEGGPNAPKNLLVGVLEPKNLGTLQNTSPTILRLGAGPTNINTSNAQISLAIHLAMWDGREWTKAATPYSDSNSGEVIVTLTMTPTAT